MTRKFFQIYLIIKSESWHLSCAHPQASGLMSWCALRNFGMLMKTLLRAGMYLMLPEFLYRMRLITKGDFSQYTIKRVSSLTSSRWYICPSLWYQTCRQLKVFVSLKNRSLMDISLKVTPPAVALVRWTPGQQPISSIKFLSTHTICNWWAISKTVLSSTWSNGFFVTGSMTSLQNAATAWDRTQGPIPLVVQSERSILADLV